MQRMPFKPPTSYYDTRISSIDEQICSLIRERKKVSNNNPGFPPVTLIAGWAKEFGLYEDLLRSLFAYLRNENIHRPSVEPETFLRLVPILKSQERDGVMYTITYVRQYNNASVVHLQVDCEPSPVQEYGPLKHRHFQLSAGQGYDCRYQSAGGSRDAYTYRFVISPALPDRLEGIHLTILEQKSPYGDLTGFELSFDSF